MLAIIGRLVERHAGLVLLRPQRMQLCVSGQRGIEFGMSKTRNNHYVPQWYQEGFFEPSRNTLAYLDLTPPRKVLDDGRIIAQRAEFTTNTSRAFCQRDLYSTFFGTSINDEIERKLFGDIDSRGAPAIRAFVGTDIGACHRHFQTLFEYIDVQKIRTPKGLDWLKAQYPTLSQNELMMEMQGIRLMHCTIWSEGVREIVSAEEAEIKFILTDHPVTIYNLAVPPQSKGAAYPLDPAITLKGSQTIFPLNRDFCLIFTNLEYARDASANPLMKRTFARNYRNSMVRTDSFIRDRKLTTNEVIQINFLLKSRARRYIAAGRKEWLYPEKTVSEPWQGLRDVLMPPKNGLFHFGGELFAKFDDGHVHYQDEFGRTEKEREFLIKTVPAIIRPRDLCGCGSGMQFKTCCQPKPVALRPTWKERSIRERNIMLLNGFVNVLGLQDGRDWLRVRRELTDEQISKIYSLYDGLWPLETDLLQLLPKPDGVPRAVYTGSIHPIAITEFALGSSLYFGELLIQHPFAHPRTVKDEFNPVKNPRNFRQEFLKNAMFFLTVMPLVEAGLVNLVPDPCYFDFHLRDQVMYMAQSRSANLKIDIDRESGLKELAEQDFKRSLLSSPPEVLRSQIAKAIPELTKAEIDEQQRFMEKVKQNDPLAVLQEGALDDGEKAGQFSLMKLTPNFEMAMYLAQAMGAAIVTDSHYRWQELQRAIMRRLSLTPPRLPLLAGAVQQSTFAFPRNVQDITVLASNAVFGHYPALMRDIFKYLSKSDTAGTKPNLEANFAARFGRMHAPAQKLLTKARIPLTAGRIVPAFPAGSIQDNTVNRLLLMSSSEMHLHRVPMAFYIETLTSGHSAR
jgi:hypothetical protein